MPDKIFSEDEIQQIIKRASSLQHSQNIKSDKNEPGLTMDELLSVGNEAGLDVKFLKTAALELRNKKVVRYSGLTDTHIFEEREFNTDAPEDLVWDDITSELTHHFGGETFGKTNHNHRKKEWTHTSISGIETIVSLTKREDYSKLRFSQRVGLGSPITEGIMYGAVLALVLGGLTSLFYTPTVLRDVFFIGSSLWGASSMVVYALDVAWRKKKLRGLKTLADKIIDQLPASFQDLKTDSRTNEKDISTIEIESQDVYQTSNDEKLNLKNNLKE